MIIPNLDRVVPFFQPIIRTIDQNVFAYEVLAREEHDGKIRSLGPYFEDPAVSDEDKLTLDICVRERALKAFSESDSDAKLFINLNPSWIYASMERRSRLPILDMLERYGLEPQRIVIEVTEEELSGDNDVFGKLLAEYRRIGCMLAIDDFGKGGSSVGRIAYVMPDIIKMDHSIVRKTDTHRSFYEICSAMKSFGAISGFELLFEGVETAFQLERCVKTGWCYLQGFLFAQARPGFGTDYANRELLSDILYIANTRERLNFKYRNELFTAMKHEMERLCPLLPAEKEDLSLAAALHRFATALPYYCLRCFVCDYNGRRLSQTYRLTGSDSIITTCDISPGELSHGVFTQGLNEILNGGKHGYLSEVHKNVAAKEHVMTYMHKLEPNKLLCVDIMATVLA